MSLAKLQLLQFPKGGGSGRPDKADRVLQPLQPKMARFKRIFVAEPVLEVAKYGILCPPTRNWHFAVAVTYDLSSMWTISRQR